MYIVVLLSSASNMVLSPSFVVFHLVICFFVAGAQTQDSVGGRSVLVADTQSVNWFRARESCMSVNMTLLEIYNGQENIEALNLLTKYDLKNAWIGGNDLAAEDEYRWMNGTEISEMFWSPAAYDQRGGGQDCMAITSDSRHPVNWIDHECKNSYPYICQPFNCGKDLATFIGR